MNKQTTKRALLLSCLSLLLCMSMLVGTTFAWFTDTDTTAVNQIVAGTLDIEIVDETGEPKEDALSFVNVKGETDILWEPNATFHTEKFAIKNNGNLWLKFKLFINNTEVSYNKLNEVITFTLVDAEGNEVDLSTMKDIPLEPKASTGLYYIKGYMDKEAGNEYQGLTLDGVSITVYATQYTKENDIYDDQYDADAPYDDEVTTVGTADEFIAAFANLEEGGIITLTGNIDMTGKAWTPVSNKGFTLDGNGYTITGLNGPLVGTTAAKEYTVKDVTFKNLTANGVYGGIAIGGVIAYADTCSYINMENVTIDGATISGAEYVGGFAGYTSGYGVDTNGPVNASHNFTNCTIINSTLTSSTDGSVGGLIGHAGSNAATTTRVNGFSYSGLVLAQTDADRPEKTGCMIGTANVGVVYITDADINVELDIGRFVPNDTGKLTINNVEYAAFSNMTKYNSIVENEDISQAEIQELLTAGANGVIDFGGSTVIQKPGTAYALYYPKLPENATITNLNTDGSLYGLEIHGDITFENCSFAGQYAINISDGNAVPGKVTFVNCTIQGWISFAESKVTEVEFINCTFLSGEHTLFMNNYQNTTFTDCTFDSAFGIDDESAGEQTWTFTNCTGLNEAKINATGSYKTVTVVIN